jgi:hypothetical protein
MICACSLKFTSTREYYRHRKEKQHQIIDKQDVIRCCNTQDSLNVYLTPNSAPMTLLTGKLNQCNFKCRRRYFEPPGLFAHLEAKHGSTINIRVQCCNPDIKRTLDEYRNHVSSQHTIADIQ